MANIEILQTAPLTEADDTALAAAHTVHRLWQAEDQAALLAAAVESRAIITRGDVGAAASLIGALPKLEVICCFGVGVDAIDLKAARARNIAVSNTPDVLTDDTADIGMALILATLRRIAAGDRHVRAGAWLVAPLPLGTSLKGKRLGIFGLGRIGQALAQRAAAHGMVISYCNRTKRDDVPYAYVGSLIDLAANSDVLAITAAASDSTRGVINAGVLAALGPKGTLINIARGSVIDEPALFAALIEGRIAGAGLDVYLNEPRIDAGFLDLPNTVLLPHVGSSTAETRAAMGQLVRDNLDAHFAGRPLLTPVG